jgi:hypothetical protein
MDELLRERLLERVFGPGDAASTKWSFVAELRDSLSGNGFAPPELDALGRSMRQRLEADYMICVFRHELKGSRADEKLAAVKIANLAEQLFVRAALLDFLPCYELVALFDHERLTQAPSVSAIRRRRTSTSDRNEVRSRCASGRVLNSYADSSLECIKDTLRPLNTDRVVFVALVA